MFSLFLARSHLLFVSLFHSRYSFFPSGYLYRFSLYLWLLTVGLVYAYVFIFCIYPALSSLSFLNLWVMSHQSFRLFCYISSNVCSVRLSLTFPSWIPIRCSPDPQIRLFYSNCFIKTLMKCHRILTLIYTN